MRASVILGCGAALIVLAGCGSSDQNTPTPKASVSPTPFTLAVGPAKNFGNACRLLTTAEVQSGLGQGAVTASSRTDPQLGSFCTWTPSAAATSVALLSINVIVEQSAAVARSEVDLAGGPAVNGLGDDAHLAKPGGLGVALSFSKGATYVVLSSIHKGVTDDQLQKLAGTIVGRL